MKSFSTFFKCLALALVTAAAAGCSGRADGRDGGDCAKLIISVREAECVTRTSCVFGDDGAIEKLLVLFYNEDKCLTGWKYSAGSVSDGETMNIDGLVFGSRYYIYALSEMEMPDDIFNNFGTVDKAERFSWDRTGLNALSRIPFAYVPEGPVLMEKDGEYKICLERILAKINFMVDCSALEGSFDIKSLNIRQSPAITRPLCAGNATLRAQDSEDGDRATAQDITTLNEGGRTAYYLMENLQGDAVPGNSDPWSKIPQKMADGKGNLATYVEICGDYRNKGLYVRNLKYRFFLGEDTVSNCDLRRNTVQTVTLMLTDSNVTVVDNWKITPGEVEDNRRISSGIDTVHIFPFPGREDTVRLSLSPSGLSYMTEVTGVSPSAVPFSIENRSGEFIIKSEKYLPEGSGVCIYPVCASTLDHLHSDTVAVVYHPLKGIGIELPYELYSNFEGMVMDGSSILPIHGSTASSRPDAGACLSFVLDYGGIYKRTMGGGAALKDTVYERGIVLTSSDGNIVRADRSTTNPTLWYLKAVSPGNAGLSARAAMGDSFAEGFRDIPIHILNLTLTAKPTIGVGASCSPSVSLINEKGERFAPVQSALSFISRNRSILTDAGIGVTEGRTTLNAEYAGSISTSKLSDSREITVSNSADEYWQLVIAPSANQYLYEGESRRDTAYLVHYVNGVGQSREEAYCSWSISDPSIVGIGSSYGSSIQVNGLKASSNPVSLNATHDAGNGISYHAKASISVSALNFYTDRQVLVWLANEKEAGCARSISITANPSLGWTASLSGDDYTFFTLSRSSGTGSGTISVYPAMENANYNNDRTATLTLSAGGAQSQSVSLRHRRDSLLKLHIVPHTVTLDLNAESNRADTLLRLTSDWLSGRSGVSIPNNYAEWSSSAPEVARSAGYGKVQAYGTGSAGIRASWRSVADTARINVINTGSYDTTYIVRIKPDTDQSISYNGSVQFRATAQMLVNTRYIGEPFDVSSTSTWISTEPAAAGVNAGLAVGCNTGTSPLKTMIYASYRGFESNYVLLNVDSRAAEIKSIRLVVRALSLDEEGRISSWQDGYISAAVFHPGDNSYNNGEQSEWCTIHGGTHYDTDATIEVALYATMNNGGEEQLLSVKSFTFSAMRGDTVEFTQADWPGIFNPKYFTFKAKITVD